MKLTYFLVYLGSLCAALLLTPVVIRVARALKLVDMPSLRKVHRFPVPRLGGVAIAFAMLLAAVPALLLGGAHAFGSLPSPVLALLGGAAAMLMVGLLDDLFNLPAQIKLVAVILASLLLCAGGGRIDVLHFTAHGTIHLGWMAWPVTVLWITVVTVSINFIDGLDGLAAGISAVACGVIAVLAASSGNGGLAVVSLALLGSLTGFLVFNFNPARVFMGDCGSMFLGFTLGACSILCASQVGTPLGLALPALALGIPLLDTLFTVIRRAVLDRRSIFSAERGHIHHRLIDRGFSHRRVVLMLYAATAATVIVGLLASRGRVGQTLTAGLAGLLVLLVVFHATGTARAVETIRALKRNRAIRREIRNGRRVFEGSQLSLHGTSSLEEWWREVCEAARLLGARKLTLGLRERSGLARTLVWERPADPAPPHEATHATAPSNGNGNGHSPGLPKLPKVPIKYPPTLFVGIPVRHRRVGPPLKLEAEIAIEREFEGAGHRIALFARLIDDCPLARLPGGSEHRACVRKDAVARVKDGVKSSDGANGSGDRIAVLKADPEAAKVSHGGNGNGRAKNGEHPVNHHGGAPEKKNGDAPRHVDDVPHIGNGEKD